MTTVIITIGLSIVPMHVTLWDGTSACHFMAWRVTLWHCMSHNQCKIVNAILFLGLAVCGDKEDINSSTNRVNFLAFLKAHLGNPQAKNATYLSPRS